MKRQIKKETLKEAIRISLKYWRTGDTDILDKEQSLCEELSYQAFEEKNRWSDFMGIIDSLTSLKEKTPSPITYETIYKVFEIIGFEVVDKEIYVQQSFEIKEVA